jgi:hypothetical protein
MKVLAQYTTRNFERRAMEHLLRCFTEQSKALGEQGLLDLIREGISRAKPYGIETEREAVKYIDLMVVFGREFDTDPRYPEARRILTHEDLTARNKIEELYAYFNDVPEQPAAAR